MVNFALMEEKAEHFVKEHIHDSKESAEKQGFWIDFFDIFEIKLKNVSQFEWNVKDIDNKDGFIDLFWKGNLVVEHKSEGKNLDDAFDQAIGYTDCLSSSEKPKYIIVSDFKRIRITNFITKKSKEFHLEELPHHIEDFDFIYNYGEITHHDQKALTISASELLANIHDELVKTNYNQKDLELFLMRILFCLYAEDTGIFKEQQFTNYIEITSDNDNTIENLGTKIQLLFRVLDQKESERQTNYSMELKEFPYVNGSLFSEPIIPPIFTKKMYTNLIEACDIDWRHISPAIFGSLFQYVMAEDVRRDFGSHYTSENNIIKVINSLFMNKLWDEYRSATTNKSKHDQIYNLEKLQKKLGKLKFFDPACGSGNFLIVAYKELRLLEYQILEKIHELESNLSDWNDKQSLLPGTITNIKIDNFYGIEIDEFSSKIAQVSMWFIEHQMNLLYEKLDLHADNLPLKQYVNIKHDNSLRVDWTEFVPPTDNVYLLGNPPFGGKQHQNDEQKEDMKIVFKGFKNIGKLDYVTAWYKKALDYMGGTSIEAAFVSTNSICQGEQVPTLWSQLHKEYGDFHINFAHQTFKWNNEAKNNASVFCVIIGFSYKERENKSLYTYITPKSNPTKKKVKQINSYLLDLEEIVPSDKNKKLLCDVPSIDTGSMPNDGRNLIINTEKEKNLLIKQEPRIEKYIKPLISAKQFINGENRYCLWLVDAKPEDLKIPVIKERIEKVKEHRLKSTRKSTRKKAEYPSLFAEIRQPNTEYIVIPRHSSARRSYIPMGFATQEYIASDSTITVSSNSKYIFGILNSRIHMIWIKYIGGKIKEDYRYSIPLYANFPFPDVSEKDKTRVEDCVQEILDIREKHNSTLFVLYDPITMPPDLKKAHHKLDKEVEKLYSKEKYYAKGVFDSEMDTLKFLLELYQDKKN